MAERNIDPEMLDKYQAGIKFLNTYLRDYEIRKIINARLHTTNRDQFLSSTSFSNYKNAKPTSEKINSLTLGKLARTIDGYIEQDYNAKYAIEENKYIVENNSLRSNTDRLQGLFDDWEAFTWDAGTTSDMNGEGYVHAFKIQIDGPNRIICETKRTTFSDGSLELIGTEKVGMQLSHPERKIFVVMNIGTGQLEDLKKRTRFFGAYIDSGNSSVKIGFTIIERADKKFEDIDPDSKPLSYFQNIKDKIWLDHLKEKQMILYRK